MSLGPDSGNSVCFLRAFPSFIDCRSYTLSYDEETAKPVHVAMSDKKSSKRSSEDSISGHSVIKIGIIMRTIIPPNLVVLFR